MEEVVRVDLRTKVIAVPPQEVTKPCMYSEEEKFSFHFLQVISKDSVPVHVDAIIYYHISDPIMSVTNVANLQLATGRLAQTLLRNALGIYSLDEILNQRDNIQQNLQVWFLLEGFLICLLPNRSIWTKLPLYGV